MSVLNETERAEQTGDIFDTVGDPNADLEIQSREKADKTGQPAQQQQEEKPRLQPANPPKATETPAGGAEDNGIKTDPQGRKYIKEGGRIAYLSDEDAAELEKQQPPPQQQQQQEGPKVDFNNPEQLKAFVSEIVKSTSPAPAAPAAAPAPTAEEVDKMLQRWKPNKEEFMKKFSTPETAWDALMEMREGMARESATAANYIVQLALQDLRPVIEPLSNHVQSQTVKQWRDDFYTKYPTLKDHGELLNLVATAKQAAGWKPTTREAGFAEIAADVAKVLKAQKPDFTLDASSTTQETTTKTKETIMPKMSTTSGGGQGGAGGGPKGASKKLDGGLWGD